MRWTLTAAFEALGVPAPSPIRQGWSSINEETGEVVLTMWTDQLRVRDDGTIVYDVRRRGDLAKWRDRFGNKKRALHLQQAWERNEGRFRAIIVTAGDSAAVPRSIARRYPDPTLLMQLQEPVNRYTGEFVAISISPPSEPLTLKPCL